MHISMLVYGRAGSGKSIFASTFPKCLILDADRSHKLYAKHFPENRIITTNLIGNLQKAIKQIDKGIFPYETIVIDSLTAFENEVITGFKGLTDVNWGRNLYSHGGKKLTFDDWGSVSGSTIALLTRIRSLPINIVIVTQVETVKTDAGLLFRPSLIGKGSDESLHFPDFVGYMEAVEGKQGTERLLHLSSTDTDNFVAKARNIGGDIQAVKNPSYDKLIKLLDSSVNNLNFED